MNVETSDDGTRSPWPAASAALGPDRPRVAEKTDIVLY
jgi:hypothetical protein